MKLLLVAAVSCCPVTAGRLNQSSCSRPLESAQTSRRRLGRSTVGGEGSEMLAEQVRSLISIFHFFTINRRSGAPLKMIFTI